MTRDPAADPLVPGTVAPELVRALTGRGETVATAESLTAGLAAATIAGVPGASLVLRGGLIVYATELKARLAAVPRSMLDEHGPVSPEAGRALAVGARKRCGADWGIGLTGVAGPAEQDGHPAGTVFLGLAGGHSSKVVRLRLHGTRWQIRRAAVAAALAALLETASSPSSGSSGSGGGRPAGTDGAADAL
ncbi:CinA family protein [Tomitella cavernea]|uniref:CinA family protein n=1 Tax=Tomitella cavernea TaxID=1387982 RepID=UPI00190582A8|nr:nicotinamide-nucleotide amidohydrolase family protein [Tomitella cavernea]